MRLIDADAAIEQIHMRMNWVYDLTDLPAYLADCPTIDPVKHGRWKLWEKVERVSGNIFKCSSCGNVFFLIAGTPLDNNYNYCPNCGAKMDGEPEAENDGTV